MVRYIIILIVPFLFYGCDTRRDLVDDISIPVTIHIDWGDAGTEPNGASVWIFSVDNPEASPREYLTHDDSYTVNLKKGVYSILVFNETIRDFDYILFRGTSRFETFEAYARPIEVNGRFSQSEGENVTARPDILAADRKINFTITREMVTNGKGLSVDFSPKRLVVPLKLNVHIKSMSSCSDSENAASLKGMAGGVLLSNGELTSYPVTHFFTINNKTYYPGSENDGSMSAIINTFGVAKNHGGGVCEQYVTLYFKLRDGSYHSPLVFNVTNIIDIEEGKVPVFSIEFGNGETDKVVLPHVIGEGGDSGFDVDVSEWGDEEVIDVNM